MILECLNRSFYWKKAMIPGRGNLVRQILFINRFDEIFACFIIHALKHRDNNREKKFFCYCSWNPVRILLFLSDLPLWLPIQCLSFLMAGTRTTFIHPTFRMLSCVTAVGSIQCFAYSYALRFAPTLLIPSISLPFQCPISTQSSSSSPLSSIFY